MLTPTSTGVPWSVITSAACPPFAGPSPSGGLWAAMRRASAPSPGRPTSVSGPPDAADLLVSLIFISFFSFPAVRRPFAQWRLSVFCGGKFAAAASAPSPKVLYVSIYVNSPPLSLFPSFGGHIPSGEYLFTIPLSLSPPFFGYLPSDVKFASFCTFNETEGSLGKLIFTCHSLSLFPPFGGHILSGELRSAKGGLYPVKPTFFFDLWMRRTFGFFDSQMRRTFGFLNLGCVELLVFRPSDAPNFCFFDSQTLGCAELLVFD